MDAWETLITNSTIVSGDAWEHLNNQSGEGGTGGTLVLTDGLLLEVDDMEFEVEIEVPEYVLEIGNEFEVEVESAEYVIEVD